MPVKGKVGQPCKMGSLPEVRRTQLIREIVLKKRSMDAVARELGISNTSVGRFMKTISDHEKAMIIAEDSQKRKTDDATGIATILNEDGEDVASDLKWVLRELKSLLESAKDDEDRKIQLGSLKEIRQALMAIAEVRGQLARKIDIAINLNESPQFIQLRHIILKVLERHPEAKADFLTEMRVLQVLPSP